MSATNKPSLHVSELTGGVYIGRLRKDRPEVLDPVDVTGKFHAILLAKFGPGPTEDKASTVLRATDPKAPVYRITVERIEG